MITNKVLKCFRFDPKQVLSTMQSMNNSHLFKANAYFSWITGQMHNPKKWEIILKKEKNSEKKIYFNKL